MKRLKWFILSKFLVILYNSLVLQYLNYSLLNWGSSSVNFDKILLLQKRAVRIISNADYHAHTANLCKTLKLLRIQDLYNTKLGKFMYNYMNNALTVLILVLLQQVAYIHTILEVPPEKIVYLPKTNNYV